MNGVTEVLAYGTAVVVEKICAHISGCQPYIQGSAAEQHLVVIW